MRFALFIGALLVGALAGCGTTPQSPPAPVSTTPAAPAARPAPAPAPARATLASEQVRLAALFRGTPVVFAMQSDGRLRVTVPLRYCFEPGAAAVKPPLAAVLDRVARSQHTEPTRLRVAAAADAGVANPALLRDRLQSTRDYLVAHGIPAARLTSASAPQTDMVEIVVAEASLR